MILVCGRKTFAVFEGSFSMIVIRIGDDLHPFVVMEDMKVNRPHSAPKVWQEARRSEDDSLRNA